MLYELFVVLYVLFVVLLYSRVYYSRVYVLTILSHRTNMYSELS